ncbi:MAG: hypothetical protein P1P89_20170 [Desulfobacterales bacterium]|nr:hypothetical protein [Desulfobacterales bacterium]
MTHTLHRRGKTEDLQEDFVLLIRISRGINQEGSEEKMQQIWEVISHYEKDLVNFGNHNPNWGDGELYDMEALKKASSRIIHVVFKDRDKLKACLKEIKERDFGISVVVSGLYEETKKICSEIGLAPHTVNNSLGIHGNVDRLPGEDVLEIHTMCGHAMVSSNLIQHMVNKIDEGGITCKGAAKKLTRMCDCGIFNTYRAEKLLSRMTSNKPS